MNEETLARYWVYWESTVDKSSDTVDYYTNKREAKSRAAQCRKDDKENSVDNRVYFVYDLYEGGVV